MFLSPLDYQTIERAVKQELGSSKIGKVIPPLSLVEDCAIINVDIVRSVKLINAFVVNDRDEDIVEDIVNYIVTMFPWVCCGQSGKFNIILNNYIDTDDVDGFYIYYNFIKSE